MESRTDASEALERLAWALNYQGEEAVSVNELADRTGLSWATTKKYTQLLEVMSRIAPEVNTEDDGITTNKIGKNMESIRREQDQQLLLYLLVHAEANNNPTESIDIGQHESVLGDYEETIEHLCSLGWIERDSNAGTIRLTPRGVSIAGSVRSELRNTDIERPSAQDPTQAEVWVDTHNQVDQKIGWPKADYSDATPSVSTTGTKEDYQQDQDEFTQTGSNEFKGHT